MYHFSHHFRNFFQGSWALCAESYCSNPYRPQRGNPRNPRILPTQTTPLNTICIPPNLLSAASYKLHLCIKNNQMNPPNPPPTCNHYYDSPPSAKDIHPTWTQTVTGSCNDEFDHLWHLKFWDHRRANQNVVCCVYPQILHRAILAYRSEN